MELSYLYQILLKTHLKCEELKQSNICNYSIELKKENERLCLDDMVNEFDAVIDVKLYPQKSIHYIEVPFTIMKSGTKF